MDTNQGINARPTLQSPQPLWDWACLSLLRPSSSAIFCIAIAIWHQPLICMIKKASQIKQTHPGGRNPSICSLCVSVDREGAREELNLSEKPSSSKLSRWDWFPQLPNLPVFFAEVFSFFKLPLFRRNFLQPCSNCAISGRNMFESSCVWV